MHIRILDSAADGDFPQQNCNRRDYRGVCDDSVAAQPHMQSFITLSDGGERWILYDTSPDIRAQIITFPALQPACQPRNTAIGAIVLLGGQIDHTTDLFSLREGYPHEVWCAQIAYQGLSESFPLFPMLSYWNGGLYHRPIAPDGAPFAIPAYPRLRFTAISPHSSASPCSPNRGGSHSGDNIDLFVEDLDSAGTLFYASGFGEVDGVLPEQIRHTDCLLVDGTLWCDDEVPVCEVGDKLGRQMGHLAQSGPDGMLEVLAKVPVAHKMLTHINNTSSTLDTVSAERVELDASGTEAARDGMHIQLQGANMNRIAMDRTEFERVLCDKGRYYHIHHPFHVAMYEGRASHRQIQSQVTNRFYYQIDIPLENAATLADCPGHEVRREWIQHTLDYNDVPGETGGIEAWLRLTEAVDLKYEQVLSEERAPLDVRFAVDAYVNFAHRASWQEVASSSLTELFAPQIHQPQLNSWPRRYPWIETTDYEYFRSHLTQTRRDVKYGLRITLEHYRTREAQERMLDILQFKLGVLWSMLDVTNVVYELERLSYHTATHERVWHRGSVS